MSDCITTLIMAIIIALLLGDENGRGCRNRRNRSCSSDCGGCGRS